MQLSAAGPLLLWLPLLLLLCVGVFRSVTVIPVNRRGALFRLGKFVQIVGPGLVIVIPFFDVVESVDLDDKLPGWQGLSPDELSKEVSELILREMG